MIKREGIAKKEHDDDDNMSDCPAKIDDMFCRTTATLVKRSLVTMDGILMAVKIDCECQSNR